MKSNHRLRHSYVASLALLCVPVTGYTQSILLSADQFAVLAGTNATAANPAATLISNGDVGAKTGITGFPPTSIANGQAILGGVVVNQAVSDLQAARIKLNALNNDATTVDLSGQDLGGQTLLPGAYKFLVAAEIKLTNGGILTLDAGGKNNVVWIFNIGTSLTTAANAQVVFINLGSNGGRDNGLFWNANAEIVFGADNIVAGNYLSGTSITFGTTLPASGSGSGRALAEAAVTLDGAATMDVLGAPGGGSFLGGIADGPGGLVSAGYVLLSTEGQYTPGASPLVLLPGEIYNTTGVVVDGDGADADVMAPASFLVFNTDAALTGTNTYTGGTTIDGGTLTAGPANLPVGRGIAFADSNETNVTPQLILDHAIDGTFSGAISGAGSVTKRDVGVLTLTGANTYTGGTFIDGGRVVASAQSLPANRPVTLDNGSGLVLSQTANGTLGGVVSGDGSLTKNGAAGLTLTAANTYSAGTIVDAGTLTLSGAGTLGATTGSLAVNAATLDLGASAQTVGAVTLSGGTIRNGTLTGASFSSSGGTVSAALAGVGSDLTTTSGVTTLSGVNTYSGSSLVSGGTLRVTGAGGVNGSSLVTVDGPGAMLVQTSSLAGTAPVALRQGTIDGTGSLGVVTVADGLGGVITNGVSTNSRLTLASAVFLGDATVNLRKANNTGSVALAVTGALVTTPGDGQVALNLVVVPAWATGSTYSLISYGSFLGQNTDFTLGAVAGLGARQVATLGNTGAAAGFITLAIAGDTPVWTGLVGGEATTAVVGGFQNWQLQVAGTGTEFLASDAALFDDTAAGTTDVTINDATFSPASTTFNNSALDYTLSGSGGINTGTLLKTGTGSLTISTANTYAGGTTIEGGTVTLAGAGALGAASGDLDVSDATLDLGGTSQSANLVALADASVANGTLTGSAFISSGGSIGANLAGADAAFTHTAGTTTLSGDNTYTGGTFINGGAVVSSAASMPEGGAVTLANSSSFVLAQPVAGTFSGDIAGDGSLTKSGVGALTLTGANTHTDGTFVTGGTLIADSSSLPASGAVVLSNSSSLVLAQATDGTFSGVVSGDGSLTKQGVAMLMLTGANTQTGAVMVNAGTLALSGAGKLGASTAPVTVNAATLDLGGSAQTTGAVALNGGTIRNGTLTGASYTSTGGTISAALAGAGITFTNTSGETTLSGANTYTGGTFVNGGAVTGTTASLPAGQAVTVANGAALIFNQSADGTFSGIVSGAGSLTKQGTGAVTLTGVNTYSGGTTVSTGTLVANTASLPADGLVSVAAAALLRFDQAAAGTYTGVISGAGSVQKTGAGILTFDDAHTYLGGTTVTAGTLALTGAGKLGATTGPIIVGSATLDLGGTSQTTGAVMLNGGTISNGTLTGASYTSTGGTVGAILAGPGMFTNTSGTTTLTAANTYTGGTVINGGTLAASSATLPVNRPVFIAAPATLILDEAAPTSSFGGVVTGTGLIRKTGTGRLSLGQSVASRVDIEAGSLVLNTSIGATNVSPGATLIGAGTINGDLVNNGTVSPGFSPGTITVNGDFTQGAGGLLIMELASETMFDQLVVTGSATLAGTLQVDFLGMFNPAGMTFPVITAADGVNGEFDIVTGSAAIDSDVTYEANSVTVRFAQIPFTTFAGTPNQIAVAGAVQQSPGLTAVLNGIADAADLPGALNALSPQGYEIWSDMAFARATAIAERFSRERATIGGKGAFYFEAGQRRGRVEGDADIGTADFNADSGLVGFNTVAAPGLIVGGFFNYEDGEASMGNSGGRTEVESYLVGVRAAWSKDAWFAHALIAAGYDDYSSRRVISFPGVSAAAESDTHGRQWLADLSAGRHFDMGMLTLSPFAGALLGGWHASGFTETGAGAFNNSVGDQSAKSLQSQLGLEAALNFKVGEVKLRPHARAAWLHEFSNDARSIDATLDGVDYRIETRDPQRDSARLSVGIDAALTERVSLYADVSTQPGGQSRVNSEWRAGVSIGF